MGVGCWGISCGCGGRCGGRCDQCPWVVASAGWHQDRCTCVGVAVHTADSEAPARWDPSILAGLQNCLIRQLLDRSNSVWWIPFSTILASLSINKPNIPQAGLLQGFTSISPPCWMFQSACIDIRIMLLTSRHETEPSFPEQTKEPAVGEGIKKYWRTNPSHPYNFIRGLRELGIPTQIAFLK